MMSNYNPADFSQKEFEITNAISTLKQHGININLSQELALQLKATTLFDGSDGLFKKLIKNTKVYFEYGCGKSTEFVLKHTPAIIYAVDTSYDWVNKMSSLRFKNVPERLNLKWVDVGEVANWGYPTSFKMRHNFKTYAEQFWLTKIDPDLVLIDGRFRVFCFLNSIKFAPIGTKILFDDYMNRPFYHVVEEFCKKIDTCGRQALFEVNKTSKHKVTDEIIRSFHNVIE